MRLLQVNLPLYFLPPLFFLRERNGWRFFYWSTSEGLCTFSRSLLQHPLLHVPLSESLMVWGAVACPLTSFSLEWVVLDWGWLLIHSRLGDTLPFGLEGYKHRLSMPVQEDADYYYYFRGVYCPSPFNQLVTSLVLTWPAPGFNGSWSSMIFMTSPTPSSRQVNVIIKTK